MKGSKSGKKSLLKKQEAKDLLGLFNQVRVLKDLPRGGWFYKGIKIPESLADHSGQVVFIAMILAEYLIAVKKLELDYGKVISMAVLHDLPELRTMDFPTPIVVKYIGIQKKKRMERKAFKEIFAESPLSPTLFAWWQEFDKAESLEAKIVHCADKLDMMLQVIRYEELGHQNMDDFWQDGKRIFTELDLVVFYDALRALRKVTLKR